MVAIILGLTTINALTLDVFVVLSFIGLLVVAELTAPIAITPRWRVRVRLLIFLGLSAVGYIMVQRILGIIPPGVY